MKRAIKIHKQDGFHPQLVGLHIYSGAYIMEQQEEEEEEHVQEIQAPDIAVLMFSLCPLNVKERKEHFNT